MATPNLACLRLPIGTRWSLGLTSSLLWHPLPLEDRLQALLLFLLVFPRFFNHQPFLGEVLFEAVHSSPHKYLQFACLASYGAMATQCRLTRVQNEKMGGISLFGVFSASASLCLANLVGCLLKLN